MEWITRFGDDWSDEISEEHANIDATILIVTDLPLLFPIPEINTAGFVIETTTAILMRSRITKKLIAFGHNEEENHTITSLVTAMSEISEDEPDLVHPSIQNTDRTIFLKDGNY